MSDISSANLLEADKPQSNVLSDFVQSALHSGIVSPMRGAAQIADQSTGSSIDKSIKHGADSIGISAPEAAAVGSANWVAQQLGGAAGMVVPFMLTRGAVKAGAGKVFGEAAVYRSTADLVANRGMLAAATHEAAISAASGLAFGAFLTPSNEANVGTSAFFEDRLKAGAKDAVVFGALGFTSPMINHNAARMADWIDKNALTQQTAAVAVTLRSPIFTGAISGLPAGAVAAEAAAIKDGRYLPSAAELKENMLGMAVVGGAFGTASWLGAQREGANVSNARHLTDSVGLTKPASTSQVDFRIVEGKEAISKLSNDIAAGATDAQATVRARPQIDTVTSAIFGVDHRSLGDTRTVVLDHRSGGALAADAMAKGDVSIATCAPLEGSLAKLDVFQNRESGTAGTVWLRTDQARPNSFSVAQESSAAESGTARARSVGRVSEVPLGNEDGVVIGGSRYIDMSSLDVPLPRERNMFYPDPASQGATDWLAEKATQMNLDQAAQVLEMNGLKHQVAPLEKAMANASYSHLTDVNPMNGAPPAESVIFAKQLNDTVVLFDKGRNIVVNPSVIRVETPSPSGQQTMIEWFDQGGKRQSSYDYSGPPASAYRVNPRVTVVTQESHRYVSIDRGAVEIDRTPFLPPDPVVERAVTQKAVDVPRSKIDPFIGEWVDTHRGKAQLMGFDGRSAEAILNFERWASPISGNGFMGPIPQEAYPVQLSGIKGKQYQAFRDASGRLLFGNTQSPEPLTNFAIEPLVAFKPSEVTVFKLGQAMRLSTALGLSPADGLRAAGGYRIQNGSRLELKD